MEATVVGGAPSPDDLARPASEADIRRVYLDATSMGYVINGIGPITAFIAVALVLSDSQAGLHSVALALGLISAGLVTARLDRVIGTSRVHIAALVLVALSFFLLAWAPALAGTLLAAAGVGLGFGTMLAHVNQTLTSGGGALARVRTARGTLIAQISGLMVPIVIGIGVALGVGWGFVAVPVLGLVAVSLFFTRGRNYRPIARASVSGRLARPFWVAWLFLVMISSFESAIVFWASPLVERRTAVPLEEAVLVFSAFLGGMVVSRFALSLPAVGRLEPVLLMRAGLAGVLLGTLAAWVSTSFAFSVAAFFIAGVGSGVLFPLGIALAMETAPLQPQLASSRLVLGPGLGLLVTPFILGVVADVSDVGSAWILIPVICLAAVALTVPLARDRRAMTGEAPVA
jgi:MFS family permease